MRVKVWSILLLVLTTDQFAQAQISPEPPVALNTNAATDEGDDSYPRLSTDGLGIWVAVWESTDSLGGTIGTDGDILVSRSTNEGATWTAPVALNTNAASDSGQDFWPQVTTDGLGIWVAVWESTDSLGGTIGTDGDILVSRSTNEGATWTAPVALNTNAMTDSGSDGYPQVTTDGLGNWVAVWESTDSLGGTIGGDRDILVSRSMNNGATWTPPVALSTNAATDSGQDYWSQVTTDGLGNWVAVWESTDSVGGTIGTDDDILIARSTDNGATWTAPVALNTNAVTDSGLDFWPQVSTDGLGIWLAVWWSDDSLGGEISTDWDILVSRSTNNGATWTAPAALNTNAATDSGTDWGPQISTDAMGNWVAVWDSTDSLGGTIGTDDDVLMSRSMDNGSTWSTPLPLNINAAAESNYDLKPVVVTDAVGNWITLWASQGGPDGTPGPDQDIFFTRWLLQVVDLNNLYVDFNALENGLGTEASPLDNLTSAVGIANNGATIHIAPGDSGEVFSGVSRLGVGNQPMTLRNSAAGATPVRIGVP